MGIILGLSLFVGVFIGVLISIPLVIITIVAAAKGSKRRRHVWRVFVPVALVSATLLILGVYYYPGDTGTPGSNYASLFGYLFFAGLAYAVIPAVATILAFLSTLFCPRDDALEKGGA
jgi:formate hydrogenlyase subunit 3/multisubunit Na+/H+ antiporter MnhD subunit